MSMKLTAASVLIAAATLAAQAPNDPSAWWMLDETTGTVASDSGPNGNHGTVTGIAAPTWTTGQVGNALTFNGTSIYVNITPVGPGLPIYNRRRYSFTAWVNAPAMGDRRIYSEGDAVNLNPLFTIGSAGNSTTPSNKVRIFVRGDNGGNRLVGDSVGNAFDSTWHHVAWVDNAGLGRIYIDGVLDSTFAYDPPVLTLSRVALGAVLRAAAGNWMSGLLDDVRIYPYCLTQPDIDAIRLSNAILANDFQLNQAAANLDINGEYGSTASPAVTTVAQGAAFSVRMSSTQGGFPWELAGTAGPPLASALVLPQNILNLDLTDPTVFFLNGGFLTPWGTPVVIPGFPPTGTAVTVTQSFTAPNNPAAVSLQFAAINPASPAGVSLSAADRLIVP